MRELAAAGYGVQDSDRDAGFIRAEKARSNTASQLFTGTSYVTEVSATITENGSGSRVDLQAVPGA